jgi:hypothetical protein
MNLHCCQHFQNAAPTGGCYTAQRHLLCDAMATVFIPAQWRDLSGGVAEIRVDGATLGEVIAAVELRCPGIAARLCDGPSIAPGLAVSIDGSITSRGLLSPVEPDSEIHVLPAIGGG